MTLITAVARWVVSSVARAAEAISRKSFFTVRPCSVSSVNVTSNSTECGCKKSAFRNAGASAIGLYRSSREK